MVSFAHYGTVCGRSLLKRKLQPLSVNTAADAGGVNVGVLQGGERCSLGKSAH